MKGIIINSDVDGIIKYIGRADALPTSVKDIEDFPKEFEGSQVTDYFLNVAEQIVTFPSERYTSFLSKYYTKEEMGIPVDYSQHVCARGAHIVFEELGVDHNQIMIDGFRKAGINPWISFRMNDYHDRTGNPGFNVPDLYYEHPEYSIAQPPVGFGRGFSDRAFDYSRKEVRDHQFGMIAESLERYDCYGVELDFQREAVLFAYGKEYEGVEIMNDFLRRVKTLIHEYEAKYGHEIKVAVHVPSDFQTCYDLGMDIAAWARERLIDMVIPSGRFESNDNDIPVKLWASIVKPYGVILAPGIEMNLRSYPGAPAMTPNIETFAAFAANAYAQGADKIYIYNFFRSNIHQHFDKEGEFDFDPSKSVMSLPTYWTIINTIGDPDAVQKMNRRHIVTYKDRSAMWVRNTPSLQLPMIFGKAGEGSSVKLFVGDIPKGAELTLRVGFEDPESAIADPPRALVNADMCEYIGTLEDTRFAKTTLLCYSIPEKAYSQMLCPRISVNAPGTINYVEIYVKVK